MAENNHCDSKDLIDISSPNPKDKEVEYNSPASVFYSEEDLKKALHDQEHLLQEQLAKKEGEALSLKGNVTQEKAALITELQSLVKTYNITRLITEELCGLFLSWKEQRDRDQREMTLQNQNLKKERDQALEDLKNVETAFADLHRRYEQAKTILESLKQNEERLRCQLQDGQNKLDQQEQMYAKLRTHTEEKLSSANQEIENILKSGDAELTALRAQLKKSEMVVSRLEKNLEQKEKENQELSNICDELIAKVGKS